jgi:hypothetical protein
VTNEQLYIVIGIPMLSNATLIGLVIAMVNAKIGKVESRWTRASTPLTHALTP